MPEPDTTASEAAAVRELERADDIRNRDNWPAEHRGPDAEYFLGRAFAFGLLAIAEAISEASTEASRRRRPSF